MKLFPKLADFLSAFFAALVLLSAPTPALAEAALPGSSQMQPKGWLKPAVDRNVIPAGVIPSCEPLLPTKAATQAKPLTAQTLRSQPLVYEADTLTIGELTIPDVHVTVNDKLLVITQRLVQDPFPLLKGVVLRYENDAVGGGKRHITGIALFNEGQLSSRFVTQGSAPESIFRSVGAIEGTIITSEHIGVMVQGKNASITRIDPQTISYVRSPRAFIFSVIQSGDTTKNRAVSLTFQPTTAANNISMSSVVLPKNRDPDDLLLDDDDISIFGKSGGSNGMSGVDPLPPLFGNGRRAFSNWP